MRDSSKKQKKEKQCLHHFSSKKQKKKKGHKPFPRDLNLLFESRCYSKQNKEQTFVSKFE